MCPDETGRSPSSASHSSVCPLPCTPARPRISPARTWNDISFTQTRPVSSATVRSSTSSTTSPGLAGSLLTFSCTFPPTIIAASSSPLLDADRQVLHQRVRVDLQPVAPGQLPHVAAGLAPVEQAGRAGFLHAEGDVLGHGEHRYEHEVLVHHPYAGRDGGLRRVELGL